MSRNLRFKHKNRRNIFIAQWSKDRTKLKKTVALLIMVVVSLISLFISIYPIYITYSLTNLSITPVDFDHDIDLEQASFQGGFTIRTEVPISDFRANYSIKTDTNLFLINDVVEKELIPAHEETIILFTFNVDMSDLNLDDALKLYNAQKLILSLDTTLNYGLYNIGLEFEYESNLNGVGL